MKTFTFLLILFTFGKCVLAQETVTLKPGDSPEDFLSTYRYRFPEFVSSRVIYTDNTVSRGKLNYNQFTDKMEFIGPKGDTLEMDNNSIVKEVVLDKSRFFFDNGYFELVTESPDLKFAVKRPIRLIGNKKVGAMGIASSTQAIDTYGSLPDIFGPKKLTVNVEYVFSVAPVYYFGDANYRFVPATQKNLLKIVPDKKEMITGYLKNNQVSFAKLESILGLVGAIKN